jgi:integrase
MAFRNIQERSRRDYLKAVFAFEEWYYELAPTPGDLPQALAEYVFWAYSTGEVSKAQVSNLLSSMAYVAPFLERRHLALARKAMQGWSKLAPGNSWLPVPIAVMQAVSVCLVMSGHLEAAAAVLLAFDCYLRISEVCGLRVCDVAFPGDPRLFIPSKGGIRLRQTKAGREQWVTVRCPLAMAMLRRLVEGRSPDSKQSLFGLTPTALRHLFYGAQSDLGFGAKHFFMFHGLRHGVASHDYLFRELVMDAIMERGRWSGKGVTRRYIQTSQALLLRVSLPKEVMAKVRLYTLTPAVLRAALGL